MLKDILAISGQSGLFKLVSQGKNAVIVESLADGKRMPAHASARISALEDISIYSESGDVKLKDVFKLIFDKENGGMAIDAKKSNDELKKYFNSVMPDFDKDRVYVSDIKKVILWYNTLHGHSLLSFEESEVNTAE